MNDDELVENKNPLGQYNDSMQLIFFYIWNIIALKFMFWHVGKGEGFIKVIFYRWKM